MNLDKWVALGVTSVTSLALLGMIDDSAELLQKEQGLYCEMVELHLQDVTTGWPDYKHTYEEVCI